MTTQRSTVLDAYNRNPNNATARKAFEEIFGTFNEAPPGWREIKEQEFVQGHFFTYNWERSEYRQIHRLLEGGELARMVVAKLFFYWDGTGVAMEGNHRDGKVRFYAFGCAHSYIELGQKECRKRGIQHMGRCWHVNECKKCGNIWSFDSSD